MNFLALDTSTKNFSLAVSQDEELMIEQNKLCDKVLSNSIIPAIKNILQKSKIELSQIDCFVVGRGPGSFTGLRVGLSTIKALALATHKPVVGIPTLDAIALNSYQPPFTSICVMSDARRDLVYACLYQREGDCLKRKSKYLLTTIDDVLKKVKPTTLFTGDAVKIFRKEILQYKGSFTKERYWSPRASCLIKLAWPKIQKRDFDDIDRLVPLYLYPKDCQVQR